ncbi:MAG: dihydrodipicolinate reductase [Candidatus Aenigmatarchaeota archaeon]
MEKIRFVQYGIGAVGADIARTAIENGFQLVGAIDIEKSKIGRDAYEFIFPESDKTSGILISDNLDGIEADICFLATSSKLSAVMDQLEAIVSKGMNVLSTCEELAYPWLSYTRAATELNKLAKQNEVTILGTGINPGFVMDFLPIILSTTCKEINLIKITRSIDPMTRRAQFQKKVGIGMTEEEFNQAAAEHKVGHVGLRESLQMIADVLRVDTEIKETFEPITKNKLLGGKTILGVKQTVSGDKLELNFLAYEGAHDKDVIEISGIPSFTVEINPGISGDHATAAIMVKLAPKLIRAKPGLHTMSEFFW